MHRSEDPSLSSSGEIIRRHEQHLVHVHHALGGDSHPREDGDEDVVPPVGDPPHLQPRPPRLRRRLRQVLLLHHLEPDLLRDGGDVGVAPQPGEGVAALDPLYHLHVLGVVAAVELRRHPLVGDVVGTRLDYAVDLGVDLLELRRVAGGLDGVGAVEAGVGERHLEEVAADDLAEVVEAGLLVVGAGALHLVLVDGDPDHVGAGVGGDGAHRAADAAAGVEDAGARADLEEIDGHLLMEARGVTVGLPRDGGGEVEGLAPPPLVDVGDEVVEGVDERRHLLRLLDLLGAAEEGPVLLVVVLDILLRD